MKIKESIVNEYKKIIAMNRQQKWEYYKAYYLIPSIVILIGIVLFIWFIKDVFMQPESVCLGCVYGVDITDKQKEELSTGYLEYYGYNSDDYFAAVSTDNMFEGTAQQMDANGHEMALFAQIAAGEIYYLILDEDTLNLMANGGIYASLDEVLPEDVLTELGDKIVWLEDPETKKSYAMAIDLNKLGFLNESGQEGYLVYTIAKIGDDFPLKFYEYLKAKR